MRLIARARELGGRFLDDGCPHMAAAISYYVLLSLFPALILILAVVGTLLRGSHVEDRILEGVIDWIPATGGGGSNILVVAIRHVSDVRGRAYSILALGVLAWSASGMFGAVRHAINVVFRSGPQRPFLHRKGLDLAMVLAMGLFFLLSIGSTAAIETLRQFSRELSFLTRFWLLDQIMGESGVLWALASRVVPFALSFGAFFLVYRVAPYTRQPLRRIVPSALVGALLFEISKLGFVLYLRRFGGYSVVFGSLGAVAAFLFWVYVEAIILLVGAELAAPARRT